MPHAEEGKDAKGQTPRKESAESLQPGGRGSVRAVIFSDTTFQSMWQPAV